MRAGKLKSNDLVFYGSAAKLLMALLFIKHVLLYKPTGAACFGDELIYKENAVRFLEGLKIQKAHYPPLYALIIASACFFTELV